ncbi:MAG: hypothetical protein SFV81_29895, partial [Pirellulaceae bacterium]|nr:hypothetical protein [Pirellulaceae bacterium]
MPTSFSTTTRNCLVAAVLAGTASWFVPVQAVLMAVLIAALVWATVMDLKTHRIPNYISYPACIAAVVALSVTPPALTWEQPLVVASLNSALYGGCVC